MSSLRAIPVLILGACLAATGCVVDVDAEQPFEAGDLEVPIEETGLGCGNGITPACFWGHNVQAYMRSLATTAMTNATGYLPAMPAIQPTCYGVIKDLVECALPPTRSAKNPHTGDVYTGLAGLAPNWTMGGIGATERRWVTACMAQRLNAFGISVSILLEGNHPSMLNNPSDDALYPYDESTAWGDLFSSTMPLGGNGPAFVLNVCSEVDLNKQCRDRESALDYRICDTAGVLCGMSYMGTCGSVSSGCVPNGPYWVCGGNAQTIRVQLTSGTCH